MPMRLHYHAKPPIWVTQIRGIDWLVQYGKKAVLYFWFANEDDNYINTRTILIKNRVPLGLIMTEMRDAVTFMCIFLDYKRVVRATMAAGVQS